MLLNSISLRSWHVIVAACCSVLLAFALYKQYQDFLDPCPLCIFQRVGFMWMGAAALLAAIHKPSPRGQRVYNWIVIAGALFGASIAGRHVWLQHLPADLVPECGPGLNYMLENFPLSETLATVFRGSGSCAEVHWSFLGLSMPEWTLTWFLGLGAVTVWLTVRK